MSVEKVEIYRILVEKVEAYVCRTEETNFFKMSVEKVEKVELYQFLIQKVETYLCGVEQTIFFKCQSIKSKYIEFWSRKSKRIYTGSNKQSFIFKIKCRSRKSRKSDHESNRLLVQKVETYLYGVEQTKFHFQNKVSVEKIEKVGSWIKSTFGPEGRNISMRGWTNKIFKKVNWESRESRNILIFGREVETYLYGVEQTKFQFWNKLSVDKIEKVESWISNFEYRILVQKVETYLCGVEQTKFLKRSVEKVEKVWTYQILVEKVETYLCGFK